MLDLPIKSISGSPLFYVHIKAKKYKYLKKKAYLAYRVQF